MSVRTSDSLAKLAPALHAAQHACFAPVKGSENPHFRSKYADLEAVRNAMFGAFAENGLCVIQMPGFADGAATLATRLLHTSGEWLEWDAGSPLTKADPQGWRAAVTYLRRTCLEGIANLAAEDDDGNTASQSPKARPVPTVSRPSAKPAKAGVPVVPFGKEPPEGKKGVPLSELDDAELSGVKTWCEKDATRATKFAKLIDDCAEEQEARRIAAQ